MNNLDFNYFCGSCPESDEYRLANCFTKYRIKEYREGDYLAYRGEAATTLSVLVSGSVSTEIILDSAISYTSRQHTAPYALGALAIFAEDNRYRADIVALEPCVTISVSREVIEDQMVKCRRFMRNFIAYNTSKIDVFINHLSILSHKSLKARLAFYILTISKNREFDFGRTLDTLSTYLCVERPSLSRALRALVDDGVISYSRGRGEILSVSAIKSLIE